MREVGRDVELVEGALHEQRRGAQPIEPEHSERRRAHQVRGRCQEILLLAAAHDVRVDRLAAGPEGQDGLAHLGQLGPAPVEIFDMEHE